MVWVALAYAIVGTWLTHLVGRPLAALRFRQQRVEADFRYSLVRVRENVEGIALYSGETEEKATLGHRFGAVIGNWWAIMQRTKMLNALTAGYEQVAVIFPCRTLCRGSSRGIPTSRNGTRSSNASPHSIAPSSPRAPHSAPASSRRWHRTARCRYAA
jgi:hypothetical protein